MSGGRVRHWICGVALAAAVGAGLVAIDQAGRRSSGPGAVWVVTRGEPQALFAGLPAGAVRILDAWGGGRIVLLHAPALDAVALPRGASWLVLRASPAAFALPACG